MSTRDRIVTATGELFRSQGFNGTSLKQVTEGAGAPIGSIYHFFPGGKDELGAAVIRESGAVYQALFEMIADESADVVEAIGNFFDEAAAAMEELDFIDLCPIGNVAREIASTHDGLRLATVDVFDSWTDAMVERMRAAGVSDADAPALAGTLIAAIEGGFMLARARRSADDLRTTGAHMQALLAAAIDD